MKNKKKSILPFSRMIIALFIMVVCLFDLQIENTEASINKPGKPSITVESFTNGKGIKITISKCQNASGYDIFLTNTSSRTRKYVLTKDGTSERTYTIKNLKSADYGVYVRAYQKTGGRKYWGETVFGSVSVQKMVKLSDGEVALEFKNGSIKKWKPGDKAIDITRKKLKYVYFGRYPQSAIDDDTVTDVVRNAWYNSDGYASVNGITYKREYHEASWYSSGYYTYYRCDSIKWRVLSNQNGKVFLVSEYGLDCKPFDNYGYTNGWALCSLRTWLNSDFMTAAFTTSEESRVIETDLINYENPKNGSYKVADSTDKIFLLSLEDVYNTEYGFGGEEESEFLTRACAPTDYAGNKGVWTSDMGDPLFKVLTEDNRVTGNWWLRTPGENWPEISTINYEVLYASYSKNTDKDVAVRPALYLDLTSVINK